MLQSFSRLTFSEHHFLFPNPPIPLSALAFSTGSADQTSHRYDWDGLKRGKSKFAIFQWTVAGRGALRFENKFYDVLPHQAMLLQVPHRHRYYLPKDSSHWQFVYVSLQGPEAHRLIGELIRKNGPVWTLHPESPPVQTALRIYEWVARGEMMTPFTSSALAYELTMQLGAEAFPPPQRNSRFAALRASVEAHPEEDFTVGAMAQMAGLSRFHFSREFTLTEGVSPVDFLLHTRVRAAALLLRDPSLSLKEVAGRSGFNSANYMTKVFQRLFGSSARDLRKSGFIGTPGKEHLTGPAAGISPRETAPKAAAPAAPE